MDATKFMAEHKRMCDSYTKCSDCLMSKRDRECGNFPYNYTRERIDKVIKVVEEWSALHPLKTRQSVFLEQYPEAAIDVHGVLQICPMAISDAYRDSNGECVNPTKKCSDCQREFWMQEVE